MNPVPERRSPWRTAPIIAAALMLIVAAPLHAETTGVSASGFTVTHGFDTIAPPAKVFRALHEIGRWWSPMHTWSGNAQNLALQPGAGGCFCERWGRNSVKHGEVIFSLADRTLRLRAALGPLQERAVAGVLTFSLEPEGRRTKVVTTYRVAGAADADLGSLAEPVDRVIGEQVARLARYVETGRPIVATR
jgi:uncharacterized protein YndB with AHSA1/START domain